jgi:hypothetical protein
MLAAYIRKFGDARRENEIENAVERRDPLVLGQIGRGAAFGCPIGLSGRRRSERRGVALAGEATGEADDAPARFGEARLGRGQ